MSRRFLVLALVLVAIAPFVPLIINGEVPILRDHDDYFVPLRHFTASELGAGRVPFWNPYNGAGEPWLANPQTAIFYPPAYLFLAFPFAFAYVAYLALHVALLAVGSFQLFVRRASPAAAALGAISVALSGPVFSMLDVGNNLTTFAWIPATLACAMARRDEQARRPRGALALMLALMFLAGEPFLAAIGWVGVAVTLLARRVKRATLDATVTFAIALLLCAAQLLPFLAILRGSDRASGLGADALRNSFAPFNWLGFLTHPGWSSDSFWTGAYPALFGSQQFIVALYVGTVVIALAALAVSAAVRNRAHRSGVVLAMSLIAAVALFAAGVHLPGAGTWWPALGLDAVRFPSRVVPFAVVALGYLAAVGADGLGSASRRERVLPAFFVVTLTGLTFFSFSLPAHVVLFTVGSAALAATVLTIGPLFVTQRSMALLALVVAFDLVFAARGLMIGEPLKSHAPRLQTILAPGERFARHPASGGYTNLLGPMADVSTPAPVIGRTYLAIHNEALYRPRLDVLNVLSVRVLLAGRLAHGRPRIRHPAFERLQLPPDTAGLFAFDDDEAYRNRDAMGPAALWSEWTVASDSDTAIAALLSGKIVADRVPVVVGVAPPRSDPTNGNPGTAKLLRIDTRGAIVDVNARRLALLTLNQNAAAGWKVAIDGKRANVRCVNGNFLGVIVPPGAHRVVWDYTPPLLHSGIALTLLGIALLISDAFAHSRCRARS
ncbi:MAG: YfhO family protein [Thermoanaerobaculia bacterium]